MTASRRSVVFWHFDRNNPYQRRLAEGLATAGWDASPARQSAILWRAMGDVGARPDVVHFHWIEHLVGVGSAPRLAAKASALLAACEYLRRRGTRLIWTAHNLKAHDARSRGVQEWAQRQVLARVDAVIVHCDCAGQKVRELYPWLDPSQVHTIPHVNYAGEYPTSSASRDERRHEARASWGIPQGATVLACFGSVRPYKGVLRLARAFARSNQDHLHLLIAGSVASPQERAELIDLLGAHPRAHLHLRPVPDSDVASVFDAADVLAFPYRDILTSGAVVLAMTFGKACLVPSIGCLPETVPSTGAFFFDGGDDALASAVDAAARASHTALQDMGRVNAEAAAAWSVDSIGLRTAAAYEAALRRDGS